MPDYIPPPSALAPGSRVWAYLRDSGGDGQEQSTRQQETEITAYCARFGLVLDHLFTDEAKSGGSVSKRAAFLDMIDLTASEADRPQGLLLWNFARFARDLDDSSYYKATLRKRGLVVHSLTDPIPEGPFGRLLETFIDLTNEEKRRQTSRDVQRSMQTEFKNGYSFGNPPRGYTAEKITIGYKRDGKPRIVSKWIPDQALIEVIRLAFKLRAEGHTYGEIREKTHGQIFECKNSFPTFFTNKAYLGIGIWGELELPGHHPAIIDQATWNAVQIHQTRRGPQQKHRPMGGTSMLSGLAFCAHCGAAMVKDVYGTGKRIWECYVCNNKNRKGKKACPASHAIGSRKAEAAIFDAVLNQVLTPAYAQALLLEAQAHLTDTESLDKDQAEIEKDLAKIDQAINNLIDLAENQGSKVVLDRLKTRESEKAQKKVLLDRIAAKREAAQVQLTPEALALALQAWRGDLAAAYQNDTPRGVKRLLARFVTRIDLGYNQAVIWYSFPLAALHGLNIAPLGGSTYTPKFSIPFTVTLQHKSTHAST